MGVQLNESRTTADRFARLKALERPSTLPVCSAGIFLRTEQRGSKPRHRNPRCRNWCWLFRERTGSAKRCQSNSLTTLRLHGASNAVAGSDALQAALTV